MLPWGPPLSRRLGGREIRLGYMLARHDI